MITAPANNSMLNDIENGLKSSLSTSQCIDRVHRDVFPGQDDWQDQVMRLTDQAQHHVQKARKYLKQLQVLCEERQIDSE